MFFDLNDENLDLQGAAGKVLEGHGGIFFDLIKGITSEDEKRRHNCMNVLLIVSEEEPEKIFSTWDFLEKELGEGSVKSFQEFYENSNEKSKIQEFLKLLVRSDNKQTQRNAQTFLDKSE